MSATKKRTRATKPVESVDPSTLPDLLLEVLDAAGNVVQVVKLPDPRKTFAERYKDWGLPNTLRAVGKGVR